MMNWKELLKDYCQWCRKEIDWQIRPKKGGGRYLHGVCIAERMNQVERGTYQ